MFRNIWVIILSILCVALSTILFLWFVDHDFGFIHENLSGTLHDIHHMESFHNASLIILTFIIACIAWIQLHGIIRTGEANFLLEIDKRYGDPYIIKARKIIHYIYTDSKTKNPNYTEPQHCEYIAKKINELGSDKTKKGMNDYVCLLNFLDFLETISLFTNNGHIDIKDINDLMNQSLDYFYTIFNLRIQERRRKYKDDSFYIQFEKLVKKLRCQKNRKCCFCCKCFFNTH